ncbi:MAG: hypothetical protein AAFX99_21505, partial [Myxococcota bacterium]
MMMRWTGLVVFGALWATCCCSPSEPERVPDPAQATATPPPQEPVVRTPGRAWSDVARGVAWDANWEDRRDRGWYGTENARKGLDHLTTLNVNWIAVTPFSFQRDIHKPTIEFRSRWSKGLAEDVHQAHARGIKVMVKPHIWSNQFWDGSGHWRGHIRMSSEAEWAQWFDHYERWIVTEAKRAEELKADAFCVGLEYLAPAIGLRPAAL